MKCTWRQTIPVIIMAGIASWLTGTRIVLADEADRPSSVLELPLTVTTVGPPWPPSEVTDANGDFIALGSILERPDGRGNFFFGPPRAVIVSKETVPPLGPDGKEDFSNVFGAPHTVLRALDLRPGSPDLDLVLHTASFGPPSGDFNGGPRIPRQGDSAYNLNALPPTCPELFPTTDQQGYLRDAYPLQQAPIWGFRGDQQSYHPETGALLSVPELPVDQRPRSAPITLGDWLKADQKSTVRVRLAERDRQRDAFTAAVFTFQFRDLIPRAVYTIWGIRLNTLMNPPPGEDISLPNPLCLPNVFSTDERGRARFECTVEHPFPSLQGPQAPLRVMGATVAFHPTYQNWGACFARYGVGVDHSVHLTTGLSAFHSLTTSARQ